MDNNNTEETVYRTSQTKKGLAYVATASLLVLAVLRVTDDRPLRELSVVNFVLTAGLLLSTVGHGLRARIRVSDRAIRKTRPLWTDTTVQFTDVRRVHLPVTSEGLWLYIDPKGRADLEVEALSFERFEEMACQVMRRLPPNAEVTDPAGRLEGYPCGDGVRGNRDD